jgi:hypothetical protein
MTEADDVKAGLWRLGLLLSGSEAGADRALRRVLATSESILKLGAERRLRLAIAGSREAGPQEPSARDNPAASKLRNVLASMELLPRVCWILRDVQGMDEVATARAVGVTKSAAENYAQRGRDAVHAALGEGFIAGVEALRRAGVEAQAEAGVRRVEESLRAVRSRRRLVRAASLVLFFGVLALLAWIGTDLMRTHDREVSQLKVVEDLSAPMSPDDAQRRQELQRQREGKPAGSELPRRNGP